MPALVFYSLNIDIVSSRKHLVGICDSCTGLLELSSKALLMFLRIKSLFSLFKVFKVQFSSVSWQVCSCLSGYKPIEHSGTFLNKHIKDSEVRHKS